jgi:hypothetical protein
MKLLATLKGAGRVQFGSELQGAVLGVVVETGVVAWELRSSVCVGVSMIMLSVLLDFFLGREGGKYIAFVFKLT